METKANFFLIGLFTLAGLLGTLAFFLWLAKIEVERQYSYYDVLFDNVAGLANAGDVRLNGLPVGQVVGLSLDEADPTKVRVRIEVGADTPVKTDTVAELQSQGVTGVSFVSLSGGTAEAAVLPEDAVIPSRPSTLQSVLEGAPVLLDRAVRLLENLNEVVSEENRGAISDILSNAASATGRLDAALADVETLTADLGRASRAVAGFADRLDGLADTAEGTLQTASDALSDGRALMARSTQTLERVEQSFAEVEETFEAATSLMEGDLSALTQQGRDVAAAVEDTLAELTPVARATLERMDSTMAELTAPARAALSQTEATFSEAEATFAAANRVLGEDIDSMIADVRGAVDAFRTTMLGASANIDAVSDEVLAASRSVSRFAGTLETVAVENEAQMSRFLRFGLPEFLRLTEEARQLVSNLDRFIDRIDRDPARYFLGTQGSEFRR